MRLAVDISIVANPTHIRLAQAALRLIALHGRTIELLTLSKSGPAWAPTRQTEHAQPVMALDLPLKGQVIAKIADDTDLVSQYFKTYLVGADYEPTRTMRARDGSLVLSIQNVIPVRIGEVPVIYKIHAVG